MSELVITKQILDLLTDFLVYVSQHHEPVYAMDDVEASKLVDSFIETLPKVE